MFRVVCSGTFFAVASFLAAPTAFAANQVIVVDSSGARGSYTFAQDGIDAANDGDVVLLRPGFYDPVTIVGKSVSLIADYTPPEIRPSVLALNIKGLAVGQKVVVRGIRVVCIPVFAGQTDPVIVEGNAGAVILEDVSVEVFPDHNNPPSKPSVRVDGTSRVVMTRCVVTGGYGFLNPSFPIQDMAPMPALRVTDSSVFVYESTLTGGAGYDAALAQLTLPDTPSQTGGPGVDVVSGFLFASGCTIQGGTGGDGVFSFTGSYCAGSSDGGPGIVAGGNVALLDTQVSGGAAGEAQPTCPPNGVAGAATVVTTGSVSTFADVARSLAITSPLHEGVAGTLAVQGAPGDSVFLLRSFVPQASFFLALKGALICQPPFFITALGPLPPSGELLVPVTIAAGTLPPGIDAVEIYEQVAVPGASGTGLLSAPTAVAIVK